MPRQRHTPVTVFRLSHISDPHLPPPPGAAGGLGELISKRTLSRLAWRRKGRQHDPAVLAALVADLQAYRPDHVVVTGDLTNFSTPAEFAAARAWLETLGPPANVTVSPGNHDALVGEGLGARMAGFAPWFGDGGGEGFPHLRRRGPVALVNLSSAIPTPPLYAGGRLGGEQLEKLDDILAQLGREGLVRVVLLHHPPVAGVVSARKALADAADLRAVLARRGAELVLHGHAHEAVFGAVGAIPVLGVPSASGAPGKHHPAARWHAIEIADDGAMQVIARALDAETGGFAEAGRYRLPALSARSAA